MQDLQQIQDYFSWSSLMTCSGATLVTTLLTQFFKDFKPFKGIPTRLFSYIIAVIVMVLAMVFGGDFSIENAAISLVNAVIVALASNGAFDAVSGNQEVNASSGIEEDIAVNPFESTIEPEPIKPVLSDTANPTVLELKEPTVADMSKTTAAEITETTVSNPS